MTGSTRPNEKFHLPNFYRGIATSIWFLCGAGRQGEPSRRRMDAVAVDG